QPGWVETSPTTSRLYALRGTSPGALTIYQLSPTGAVLNTFPAPAPVAALGNQGLADGGGSLFYVDGSAPTGASPPRTLYELDPFTGAVRDADALPGTGNISGLAYLGGLVYYLSTETNQIVAFDPVTDTVVRSMTPGLGLSGGLTGAAELGLLFASN